MISEVDSDHTCSSELVESLLATQRNITAVEAFSHWVESTGFLEKTYRALMPTKPLESGQQYCFEVDLDACSGCKSCVVACHNLNGLEENETWRKVGQLVNIQNSELPILQHITTACHHCIDPACLSGCPVKAYEKDTQTGIVRHLDDQCFGCKYCTMMCPYEVPQYSPSLCIVRKCDMCSQRLAENQAPACVQACPSQAIRISVTNTNRILEHNQNNPDAVLVASGPKSKLTLPTTTFTSKRDHTAMQLQSWESVCDSPQHGHLPLVFMLVLTQASVGIWAVGFMLQTFYQKQEFGPVSLLASLLGFVGIQCALLHLGRPWLAFRSFLGWRTSWLSREAIVLGVYLVFSAATSFLYLGGVSSRWLEGTFLLLTCLTGVAGLLCSSMIYIATGRSLWNAQRTGFEFATASLALGCLGIACCSENSNSALLWIGIVLSMMVSIPKSMDVLCYFRDIPPLVRLTSRSGKLLMQFYSTQWIVMCSLYSVAIAVLAMHAVLGFSFPWIPCMVFVLAVAAQLIQRWIYFGTVVFHRMPGAGT